MKTSLVRVVALIVLLSSAAPMASMEWPNVPPVKDAPSAKGANLPHAIPDITLSEWDTRLTEARLSNQYQSVLINRALVEEWSGNAARWNQLIDEHLTAEYVEQWWRWWFRPKPSGGVVDTHAPVVTAFTIPSTASSLTVSVSSFTATDDTAVTGYLVNESVSTPSGSEPGWSGSPQSQYVFDTEGAKTLYAWAKDAAGNISSSASDTVTIALDDSLAHWVSPTGAAEWDDCVSETALSDTSACSMATMNSSIDEGETAKLRGGTYNTQIRPTHSGTSGSRIAIRAYSGETATITGVGNLKPGLDLDGVSYIVVRGESSSEQNLIITETYNLAWLHNGASYNEIAYTEMFQGTSSANNGINIFTLPTTTELTKNTNNWFHHNKLHEGGAVALVPEYPPNFVGCEDAGGLINVGGDTTIDGLSDNNTFSDNEIYFGAHHAIKFNTRRNAAVNNFIHNEGFWPASPECQTSVLGSGTDIIKDPEFRGTCTEVGPWGAENLYGNRGLTVQSTHNGMSDWVGDNYNLIEGNRIANSGLPSDGNGADGLTLGATHNIARFNESLNNGETGLYIRASGERGDDNRVYNNTFTENGHGTCRTAQGHGGYWKGGIRVPVGADNNALKNNLLWANYNAAQSGQTREFLDVGAGNVKSHNWTTTSRAAEPLLFGDPQFIDDAYPSGAPSRTQPNLTPQNAGIIDGGTSLTNADGAGTDSVTLVVDDPLYFQYGERGSSLAGHEADWIAIGTVDNVVQITHIDYATRTITLASPKSWADDAPIWLYKDSTGAIRLRGTAPDIGAKETP